MSRIPVAAVVCWLLAAPGEAQQRTAAQPLLIENVTVIDVSDGSLRPRMTVLVRGNRIRAVSPTGKVEVPAGARIMDATGKFLIPGLWDMHVHSATGVSWHFPLLVAHGVTGVRNMHTTVDTALELTAAIKQRLTTGELLGPRFLANGPLIDGESSVWPGALTVRTPEEARAAVDSLVAGGADFIKVYDNLSRDAYFAIADQAKRHGIPMVGHVPFRVRPEEAAEAGHVVDEHSMGLEFGCSTHADSVRTERARLAEVAPSMPPPDVLVASFRLERALYETRDPAACTAVLDAYRRNGVAVVPTLVIARNPNYPDAVLSDSATMRFVPEAVRRRWRALAGTGLGDVLRPLLRPTLPPRLDNVRLLRQAGVSILAGTDLGNPLLVPGVSLHEELTLLVEAGLTPLEALQAATLNAARVLNATDSLGTIEAGKLADLVLLDANPLENIVNARRIHAVVVNGRYLDRGALNELLNKLVVPTQRNSNSTESAPAYTVPPDLGDGRRRAAPEAVELDRRGLEGMTDAIRRQEYPNVHAVLIARDGRLVYEEYFEGRDHRWRGDKREDVSLVFHPDTLRNIAMTSVDVVETYPPQGRRS